MQRRTLVRTAAILVCAGLLAAAECQAQIVDQPVRIIYPFAPGGGGDGLARLIAERLGAGINRPVVIDNRTGAGGRLGVMAVKTAAPDGSTLLFLPIAPMSIYPLVFKSLNYDPVADFEPISQVGTNEFGIAVHPAVPAKSLKELMDWVKANPDKGSFGVPAMGTLPHFLGMMFGRLAGLDLRPIAFRGAAASIADAVAGHIPMVVSGTTDLAALQADGRLRVLVTSNQERSQFISEAPTFRELGYDLVATGWYAIYAPARTPRSIIDQYNRVIVDAIRTPEVSSRFRYYGQNPTGTTPEELAAIQKADRDRWEPVIRQTGFVME